MLTYLMISSIFLYSQKNGIVLDKENNPIDKVNVLLVATTKNTVNQHNQILLDSGYKSNIYVNVFFSVYSFEFLIN